MTQTHEPTTNLERFRQAWPTIGFLFGLQAALLILTFALYVSQGLRLSVPPHWALVAGIIFMLMLAGWLFFSFGWQVLAFSHTLLAALSMISLGLICALLNYALFALDFPLVDPWLAKADAILGIPVPVIVNWVQARPLLNTFSVLVYHTLWPQVVIAGLLLGVWLKDFRSLWEYAFHFQVTAAITVLVSTVTPALGVYAWYGFTSSIDQTHVLQAIRGLRDGSLEQIVLPQMEGIISFPSFHAVTAIVVAYSLRRHRRWFWPFVALDTMMVLSTLATGSHYTVDLLAAFVVCCISFFAFSKGLARSWQSGLYPPLLKQPS
jgi:hypothetical protein